MRHTSARYTPPVLPVLYGDGPLPRAVRQDVARILRSGQPDGFGSSLDSQFLCDWVAGKYPMRGFDRLLGLHIASLAFDAAYALPDQLALFIARQRVQGALSFADASYAETTAQAAVDPLQHEALTTGCPLVKRRLQEALVIQIRTSKVLLYATLADVEGGK